MSYVVQSSWENMEIRWDANNGQLLHKSSKVFFLQETVLHIEAGKPFISPFFGKVLESPSRRRQRDVYQLSTLTRIHLLRDEEGVRVWKNERKKGC